MKKSIMRAVVILLLLSIALPACAANIHNAYYQGEKITVTSVCMKNSEGVEIRSLPETGTVTFSARALIADGSSSAELVFIAALYKEGIYVSSVSETFNLKNRYALDISVGADVSSADEVKVYVVDSIDNGRPLAGTTFFNDSVINIRGIKVGNKEIEGFDPDVYEYDFELPASLFAMPVISPIVDNQAVKSEITYTGDTLPFSTDIEGNKESAIAEITLTSSDESVTKKYRINLTQESAAVTDIIPSSNVSVDTEGNETVYTAISSYSIYDDLRDVVYTEIPDEPPVARVTTDKYHMGMVASYIPFYVDRNYPIAGVPAYLEGATYISFDYSYVENYPGKSAQLNDGLSLTINRSADIYVSNAKNWCTDAGFSKANLQLYRMTANASQATYWPESEIYVKSFDVNDEALTVTLGPTKFVIVDFKDDNNVSNSLIYTSSDLADPAVVTDVAEPVFLKPTDVGYSAETATIVSSTKIVSDKSYYVKNIKPAILGAQGIALPNSFRNKYPDTAKDVDNKNFVSFDIEKSSTVYIYYPTESLELIPWMLAEGYEAIEPTDYEFTLVAGTMEYLTGTVYKKDYNVTPGETLNVKIGGFPAATNSISRVPLAIFVKAL